MNVAPNHMALDCVFRLLHRLHHTDSRQNFLCKGNQQTTEQTEDALRSLRRVVGLHGHTELHNAPAEDDNADRLDAGKNEVGQVIYMASSAAQTVFWSLRRIARQGQR